MGTPEGGVRSRGGGGCCGGDGALFIAPILPDLVALLDKGLRILELPRVDQVPDVARQFAEEKDRLDLLYCGRLQGDEVVPHDGGPVIAAPRVVQPFACSLGGAETVGAEQDVLQLLVQVEVGSGAFA